MQKDSIFSSNSPICGTRYPLFYTRIKRAQKTHCKKIYVMKYERIASHASARAISCVIGYRAPQQKARALSSHSRCPRMGTASHPVPLRRRRVFSYYAEVKDGGGEGVRGEGCIPDYAMRRHHRRDARFMRAYAR